MIQIDNALLAEALTEWRAAKNGSRTMIVKKWADVLGVSFGTLHRKFKRAGHKLPQKKARATKGVPRIPELHAWARTIAHCYAFMPKRAGRRPAVDLVIRKALHNNLLPEEARSVSAGTFSRVLRELALLDHEGRCLRFEAKKPMQQVQYDVSGSEYLYVHRMERGEPVLRVRASKEYKNKQRHENLRVWYHGLVDDHSRYWPALPFVSPGESSADALAFCKWAFAKKDDERIIFRGLPDRIYMDNGPLARARATSDFFERLGVDIKTHEPESPSDTGKIEVKWRQLWSGFEAAEFLLDPHWHEREYTLSEIRERLMNYTQELNNRKHPNHNTTRAQAWLKVMHNGGVVDVDAATFDTAFRRHRRLVGGDGLISLKNEKYRVKGLHDAWAYIYEGIFDGQLVAEDILTHERYEVRPFAMPGLDEYRMDKKLESVKVREEAAEIRRQFVPGEFKGIYEDRGATNVVHMPVRAKEQRTHEDVFDVAVYPDMTEAMRELCEIVGAGIPQDQREVIEELIQDNGLDRRFVKDLALDIRAEIEQRRSAL